jgi:hypothetical protein
MVAFVNGKFTNASAHTSYLYLVKEQFKGCVSQPVPHTQPTRLKPSRIAAPVDSKTLNLHPVLGGPPIIYRQWKYRQRSTGKIFKTICREADSPAVNLPDEARIIGS